MMAKHGPLCQGGISSSFELILINESFFFCHISTMILRHSLLALASLHHYIIIIVSIDRGHSTVRH